MSTRRRERPPSTPRGGRSPVTPTVATLPRPEPSTATVSSSRATALRAEELRHEHLEAGAGSSVTRAVRQAKCSPPAHPPSNPPARKDDRPSPPNRSNDQRLHWSSPCGAPAGIEPATPSSPWNHQEPLCGPPSPLEQRSSSSAPPEPQQSTAGMRRATRWRVPLAIPFPLPVAYHVALSRRSGR
jgi:hypothetical protein